MKDFIELINQSIEEKRNRLKEKAEKLISAITVESVSPASNSVQVKKGGNIPPISYVLYGAAGLSTIGAFVSDSKMLCLGIAALSAWGGYKLSQTGSVGNSITPSHNANIGKIKNEIISKMNNSVRAITTEWENFMDLKQKEIQSAISKSSFSEIKKDEMMSKTYVFEVIDISLSDFSSMLNSAVSVSDIRQKLADYKSTLLSSIDAAATRQIIKYRSLCQ